jgi:hypothetical protein
VAEAADAGADQHTSEAEVASCWRPHRRRAATGAVETESGITDAGSLSWTVSKTALRESPFIMREEMPPRL